MRKHDDQSDAVAMTYNLMKPSKNVHRAITFYRWFKRFMKLVIVATVLLLSINVWHYMPDIILKVVAIEFICLGGFYSIVQIKK